MKITVITKQFDFRGGSSNYVFELSRRLVARGHKVSIITNKYKGRDTKGATVQKIPALKLGFFLKTMSFAFFSQFVARRKGFDLLQGHGNNIKQDILTVQCCYVAIQHARKIRVGRFNPLALLEQMQFRTGNYKKIAVPSNMVKKDIISLYNVPAEDIIVIPRGVDSKKFCKRSPDRYFIPLRKKLGIGIDQTVVLFVSSGDFVNRGLDDLLKALKAVVSLCIEGDLKLAVVGGDKAPVEYREKIKKEDLDSSVIFIPFQKDIESLYGIGDFLIFPTYYDSFGQVVTEAMASELPVIVSSHAGVSEIITDGEEGLILRKQGDQDEIVDAIKVMLNKSKRKIMGRKARKLAEKYTWDKATDAMEHLYARVRSSK